MADFKLTTYNSNCLLLRIRFDFDKKKSTIFDILFTLNLKYFLLNTFLKKCHFELQIAFYSNTGFYSYSDYIVNGETYSLDMLANRVN